MLTTLVLPTGGQAWVAGMDVVADPVGVKRRIGVVTQNNTLDMQLTVAENLEFRSRFFGLSLREAARRADQLLDVFGLADRRKAMSTDLSGGQAKRLLIARALVHRPDVLFLDVRGFTTYAEQASAHAVVASLNALYGLVVDTVDLDAEMVRVVAHEGRASWPAGAGPASAARTWRSSSAPASAATRAHSSTSAAARSAGSSPARRVAAASSRRSISRSRGSGGMQ